MHTPGPWAENWTQRSNGGPKEGWFVEAEDSMDRDTYGAITNLPDGRENTEDNARLIAAAPELLEALKALGRPALNSGSWFGGNCFDDCVEHGLHSHSPACEAARIAIAKAEGTHPEEHIPY